MDHTRLINSITDGNTSFLIVVGNNGAGKTTLLRELAAKVEDSKLYTINDNRQFADVNPFDATQYKNGILSRIKSTGESLRDEILDTLDNDIVLLDEPTASLDLLNTAIIIESFIRSRAKLKVISSNDYTTLKLLANYADHAYDVSTGERISISFYLSKLISDTKLALHELPFEQIDYSFYDQLAIKPKDT